jgi:signal transduction histidine kinase
MLPQGDRDALRSTIEVDNAAAERLTAEQSAHVLRLLRETISNVERHAGAQSVNVTLQLIGDRLCLEVKDDGAGIPAHGALGTGLGLHHIRVRAQRLGGKAHIHSSPGEGTRIAVDFPAAS